jgi:CheY-like chemotaxis protein
MVPPVLYAEDEADDFFFMGYAWEEAGLTNPLIQVKDGQQAIDYLAGHGAFVDREKYPLPCLLLLDLKLPLKSGFDVLRWIRQHPPLAWLKVVVVSGSEQETDITQAQSLGVTDYLVKPSSPARLAEILRHRRHLWLDSR